MSAQRAGGVCGAGVLLILLWAAPARAAEAPRLAAAREAHGAQARALIEKAGLTYPPGALLLRVFKGEDKIEVWAGPAQGQPLQKVQEYQVCARSGGPGPKRKSGDLQVPEGFYRISTLNPASSYHLSMRVDYPNEADRARARKAGVKALGGDIFIHGECVTIGCLPITNGPIEELFVLAADTKKGGAPIDVHLFPARPGTDAWKGLLGHVTDPALEAFWRSLEAPFATFEKSHVVPKTVAKGDGSYRLAP
jgi:murein L,D-transpeptidase YafK